MKKCFYQTSYSFIVYAIFLPKYFFSNGMFFELKVKEIKIFFFCKKLNNQEKHISSI
jgi:hypothetical protein